MVKMILIVDNYSQNLKEITKILRKTNQKYYIIKQNDSFDRVKLNKTKGVILTGGDPSLDRLIHLNQIRANIACLINLDVPILGICEGHEIIGNACGGDVTKLRKPSHFNYLRVKVIKRSKIFKGLPENIFVYESHSRYVSRVPKIFEVTANSRKDKIEGMFHKTKPIFGVQFHPERGGDVGEQIIKNFLDICDSYKR